MTRAEAAARRACVEPIRLDSRASHARIPYHRQQSAPKPAQIIFLGANSNFRLLVLNFGLQAFCIVRLVDILQLPRHLHRFFGDPDEFLLL